MASKPPSTAHLDAAARAKGFPDYATWAAWKAKQSAGLKTKGSASGAPSNWLQQLGMVHPANMFNYVSDKLRGIRK